MNAIISWLKHNNTTLLVSFVAFWLPLIIFFRLAREITEKEVLPFDRPTLEWLHTHSSPFFDAVFYTATTLGGIIGITAITILLFIWFVVKNQRTRALLLIASVGGAALANIGLKALFQRDRPDLFKTIVVETSYSFPSGHAMASSALALCLILLFWRTKWRLPVTAASILFVVLVGISRPYFGVHYPSDILAGWCASCGWVLLVFYVVRKFRLRLHPAIKS